MRWLLLKDLQVLRRSPLIVVLLVIYPILVAVLIGVALTKGPEKPKVAFLNEVSSENETLVLGGKRIRVNRYARQLFQSIDPVPVKNREEALEKVRSGDALGALIVPADMAQKLSSQVQSPTVEVLVNEEDPVKARFVDEIITSQVAKANEALSRLLSDVSVGYLDLLIEGGTITVFGKQLDILGLARAERGVRRAARALPVGSKERATLLRVARFAQLARQNLGVTDELLATISEPIRVKKELVAGRAPPLSSFAAAVAVAFSLMFVTVVLAAGALALEREENAFQRLIRAAVSPFRLVLEKTILGMACSAFLAVILLVVLGAFVSLEWDRFPLWLLAVVMGAAAFAAVGVAIGGIAREVRAASLIAVMLSFPVTFLGLVPSGTVSEGLYEVARGVSAGFPFRPTLSAMNVALYGTDGSLVVPLAHLAGLTAVYLALARLFVRRLG